MDEISIIGIGVISNLGNDVETIWEKLMQEGETLNSGDEILFESGLSLSQRKKQTVIPKWASMFQRWLLRIPKSM